MHKKWLIVFSLAMASGCSTPTAIELGERYFYNSSVFEQLKLMITEDGQDQSCTAVGTDHIGDFWLSSGQWHRRNNYQSKMSLEEVLRAVGLSRLRYDQYLSLFEEVKAERVTYCPKTVSSGDVVAVMSFRSGLGVSGCLGTIEWYERNPPRASGNRGGGDFIEVEELQNGWLAMMDCT